MSKDDADVKDIKDCAECRDYIVNYADGYILKDFTRYAGDVSLLPTVPDEGKFWVVKDCKKNAKKLQCLNLQGDCRFYSSKL